MTDLTDHALALAKLGLPVFALAANKRPLLDGGFKNATTDPDAIVRMFADPAAALLGVPTGALSGFFVVDIDPATGGDRWLFENHQRLPPTRTHRTRRGGFHLLYKHRDGVRCSAGKLAPGVDIRGDGGYIVWWPASGFATEDASDTAEAPDWLIDDIQTVAAPKAQPLQGPPVDPPSEWDADHVKHTLAGIERRLNNAEDGAKHATLCREAVLMGGILYATDMSENDAAAWLVTSLPPVADEDLAMSTALSGIAKGLQHPVPLLGVASHFAAVPLPPEEPEALPEAVAARQAAFRKLLSAESWANRDIPEPDRLLGDLLTTTTRVFLVGRTGLGKTLFGLDIAAGVASGAGFGPWPSNRPARVLYLDGEMPAELIKPRVRDALRRLGGVKIPLDNLVIFGRDIEDQARRAFPEIPPFAPLNMEAGQNFLLAVIKALGGVDLIIFDNVMSLTTGDQKDEMPWTETLPLVMTLTDRRIGQVWFDHTGHNSDRQYGSSTKAWRFDAVGVMTPLQDKNADPRSTGFTLSFDHPGKARRRTPDNWQQFEPQVIRLADDKWTFTPVAKGAAVTVPGNLPKLRPQAARMHGALCDLAPGGGTTNRDDWYASCHHQGIVATRVAFNARLSELRVAGVIAVDGTAVRVSPSLDGGLV